MEIKCPHCNEVISLDLYKKAIRQWVMAETSAKRMAKISPEKRKRIAQNAGNARWKKHKMGGENPPSENLSDKTE